MNKNNFGIISIQILKERIENLFEQNNENINIYVDNCDLCWSSDDIQNICLFGAALKDIQFIKYLPRNAKICLWVISQHMKNRLIHYYKFHPEDINVIDRYALFPVKKKERGYNFSETLYLVYSGRGSSLKNFDLIYNIYKKLKRNIDVELLVCGPYFKKGNFNISQDECDHKKVHFLGDLGIDWVQKIEKNYRNLLLINMATDPLDDFCVSLAQWEERGLPSLVPNIGPYKYLSSQNSFPIDLELILEKKVDQIVNILMNTKSIADRKNSFCKNKRKTLSLDSINLKVSGVDNEIRKKMIELNPYEMNDFVREILNVN